MCKQNRNENKLDSEVDRKLSPSFDSLFYSLNSFVVSYNCFFLKIRSDIYSKLKAKSMLIFILAFLCMQGLWKLGLKLFFFLFWFRLEEHITETSCFLVTVNFWARSLKIWTAYEITVGQEFRCWQLWVVSVVRVLSWLLGMQTVFLKKKFVESWWYNKFESETPRRWRESKLLSCQYQVPCSLDAWCLALGKHSL